MKVIQTSKLWIFSLFLFSGGELGSATPYAWRNATILGGGFVTGLEFSRAEAGLLYCRTDIGGAYRYDGASQTWTPLTDMFGDTSYTRMGIESIAPDPVDPDIVYAAGGMYLGNGNGFILRSTDRGGSWTSTMIGAPMGGNHDGRSMGERLAVDPNLNSKLYFASRNNRLLVSNNSAATWSSAGFPVPGAVDLGLSFVIFDRASGSPGLGSPVIYVGVADVGAGTNLYRSVDYGASWQLIVGTGTPPSMLMPNHGALAGDGSLYLSYSDAPGPNGAVSGGVWKLNTSSLAWTRINPSGVTAAFGGVSVDASDPLHLLACTIDWWGGPDRIFRSVNGGVNWSIVSKPPLSWSPGNAQYDVNGAQYLYFGSAYPTACGWMGDVEIDPYNPSRALNVTGQGIWETFNLGASPAPASVQWAFQNRGLEECAVTDMVASVNGALLSGLGDLGGMRHPDLDQPAPLGAYTNPVFGNTSAIEFAGLSPSVAVRCGTNGSGQTGAYSLDNGQTWAPFPVIPSGTARRVAVSADGSRVIWAPSGAAPRWSVDYGASWTNSTGVPSGARVVADRVHPLKFYAMSGGTVYLSTDGAASFSAATTGLPAGSALLKAVFGVEGELWMVHQGLLYSSTLSGASMAQVATVQSANAVGFGQDLSSPGNHPCIYVVGTVAGVYGFYRSDDEGSTWTRINDAQHQFGSAFFVAGDEGVPGRAYVGTNGRGILVGELPGLLTPTITRTFTPSFTVTPSFSASPTPTPSRTPSPTFTGTPSWTLTVTPSATPTATGSSSHTPTGTPSGTGSPSPTCSPSSVDTASPTSSPSPTETATATPSPTQIPSQVTAAPSGPPLPKKVFAVPNPDPSELAVYLEGPAAGIEVRFYSAAMALVAVQSLTSRPGGWVRLPLPHEFLSLNSNGSYFAVVFAADGAGKRYRSAALKFYRLR